MYRRCAFSGHRDLYNYDFDKEILDRIVCRLIETGTTEFLCGMALGFDIAAAESVLKFKKDGVKLIACLPCGNQSEGFSQKNKKIYDEILGRCDEKIVLADTYFNGCMQARDRYMVDNSDLLVAFLRKDRGGTLYTVNYARRSGKKVIEL